MHLRAEVWEEACKGEAVPSSQPLPDGIKPPECPVPPLTELSILTRPHTVFLSPQNASPKGLPSHRHTPEPRALPAHSEVTT